MDSPSSVASLVDTGELLRDIAAGIGGVTPTHHDEVTTLRRELVLRSPAYDVWVMHWPAGVLADLHQHEAHVAFHVVAGALVEERLANDGVVRTELRAGDTAVVPPRTPHQVRSLVGTTTVHVHATS